MDQLSAIFLSSALSRLTAYKHMADKTFAVLDTADFHFTPNVQNNSIAIIIQHMAGNMLSRWTDFLTTDGEKPWRKREAEFEVKDISKKQLLELWENGWACCLAAIKSLGEDDLMKTIYIRSEGLNVVDAINRQLAHYSYHVGQIVYLGKMIKKEAWAGL